MTEIIKSFGSSGINEHKALPRKAAMYVRMSTDHQKYSTENQADCIREYAGRCNIEIIRTYTDSGKSGLKLDGRDALKQLIEDVQAGAVPYSMILVLDVNRMLFIVEALRRLMVEENFVTLLKAEGLTTMPKPLAHLVEEKR